MKLSRIAEVLGCDVPREAADIEIARIASVSSADERSVTFLSDERLRAKVQACAARAVIVRKGRPLDGKVCLEVDDPYLGYAKAATIFENTSPLFDTPVHDSAVIDERANIDATVRIGPATVVGKDVSIGPRTVVGAGCVIEKGTTIGADCRIDSGVVLRYDTRMGDRVIVQSGSVIGSDGFANATENGAFVRIPCFGNVVIEDDVQIGACVTIDRGNFEPTVIRKGVRLDNLIQIAHNVEVGEHSAMAAQAGVSGSTRIGKHVLIGGQAGFVGHIEIGDGAVVGAQGGVTGSVKPGARVTSTPARDIMRVRRIEAAQTALPGMLRRLKSLEKRMEQVERDRLKEE